MLKKVILASAILTASTAAFATTSPALYLGAGLGVITNTSNNGYFGDYRGVPLNVFAGYGGVIAQNFYLAGELNGTITSGVLANNGLMKTTYGYGASVLPGVMLADSTLAFVRLGVVRTRFPDLGTMQTGGQAGFGLQTSLTQSVDLRGEYDFTAYRSISKNFWFGSLSTKPRQDAFNLSLVYKFS